MLRHVGEGVAARAPFHCEYGAVSIGDRTFVNVDAIMLDVVPITIADNVWLGGGVIVCPGVPARVRREIGEEDRVEVPDERSARQ